MTHKLVTYTVLLITLDKENNNSTINKQQWVILNIYKIYIIYNIWVLLFLSVSIKQLSLTSLNHMQL